MKTTGSGQPSTGTQSRSYQRNQITPATAFDISPRMKECMPGPTSEPIEDKEGYLGYCWMHHLIAIAHEPAILGLLVDLSAKTKCQRVARKE